MRTRISIGAQFTQFTHAVQKNENENLSVLQVLRNLLLAGAGLLSSVSAAPQFGPLGPAHHAPLHHAGPGYAPAKIPPRPFAYEYGVQVGVILTR